MQREKLLARNTLIYFIGSMASKLLGFAFLLIYTHYMSREDLGAFDLVMNTLSIVIPLATLCMTNAIFRFVLDNPGDDQTDVVLSNGMVVIFSGLLVTIVFGMAYAHLMGMRYPFRIALLGAATVLYTVWQQIARALKKNQAYALSGVLLSMLILLISAAAIPILGLNRDVLFLVYSAATLLAFVYLELKLKVVKRLSHKHIKISCLKEMMKFSLPLIPAEINWWAMSGVARYIIVFFLGLEANGVFSVAARFSSLLAMVNEIFNRAWYESAILEFRSKDRDHFYSRVFNLFLRLQLSAVLVMLPLVKYIIRWMVNPDYQPTWQYVPGLLLGAMFLAFSDFFGTGYITAKKTQGAFYSTLFAGCVNIVLLLVTIRFMGLHAAALAHCVTYLSLWLFRVVTTREYFVINIEKKAASGLIFLVPLFIAGYFIDNGILDGLMLIIALITAIIFNRELMGTVLKTQWAGGRRKKNEPDAAVTTHSY